MPTTSPTLLQQMKNSDNDDAWNHFFHIYSPLILSFARRKNCTSDMAQDILQETMVCVMKQIPGFRYRPGMGRFRSYLYTIVQARIADSYRRNRIRSAGLHAADDADADGQPANPDGSDPTAAWEEQWRRNLLHQALEILKKKVNRWSYDCFVMYALEGRNIDVVRERLMKTYDIRVECHHVYSNKNRLIRILTREIKNLEAVLGD